jgi:hypothetical protein
MQIPREPRQGGMLDWAWGAQVVRYLRSIAPQSSPSVRVSRTSGGTTFEALDAGGRGGTGDCPFAITLTEAGSAYTATFRAGTINSLLPSNYLTGVAVPATGTKYLVLTCTASNGEITAATFSADATAPAAIVPFAGQPPTSFKILIGVVIDGALVQVWGCGNIQALGVESFRVQKGAPVAGQVPYDVYYTWSLSLLG